MYLIKKGAIRSIKTRKKVLYLNLRLSKYEINFFKFIAYSKSLNTEFSYLYK